MFRLVYGELKRSLSPRQLVMARLFQTFSVHKQKYTMRYETFFLKGGRSLLPLNVCLELCKCKNKQAIMCLVYHPNDTDA